MVKDYAATREEWAERLYQAWMKSLRGAGQSWQSVADDMIAQGWLPVKEPERPAGQYAVVDAEGYERMLWWWKGEWYYVRDHDGHYRFSVEIAEPYTCTRLRPDSEVKG